VRVGSTDHIGLFTQPQPAKAIGVCGHGPGVGDKFPQTELGTAPTFYTNAPAAHLGWPAKTIAS
jgi:hypothetical protein